jgi:hypothetical protein
VAKVEAKKKMEKGPPERQGRLLSGFWTFSLSTTFPEIPLCGPTRSRLWRGRRILRSDSIAGASSGGNDFVPDAVGDVADQDLGPGIVLGGGGGEDVIEEVWWRTWRRRKKGRQNARGDFYQISGLSLFPQLFPRSHLWGPTRSCLWRGRRILRSDSIGRASSGGDNFVPDAVEDVADQDLGPGIVLGGGGGEDVVEEVWWRTWRQRKKGRQNARGNFYQISGVSLFPQLFPRSRLCHPTRSSLWRGGEVALSRTLRASMWSRTVWWRACRRRRQEKDGRD